ncbi:hypothetical protein PVK06_018317 [Gossypium arboreum]|uniref:Uncharacterized protein n=1 Tax=Gossypium arboreum TaxID=29729 RepID=A0ABR0Q5X7_GOSAR|nr:hypothetical protein PVK06_018317 [Gossypium arboreum]
MVKKTEDFLHLARRNDSLTEKTSSIDSKSNQKRKANEEAMADRDQGLASQTMEKLHAAEALNSHPKVDAVKDRYKDHEPGADYNKTGDKLNHKQQ